MPKSARVYKSKQKNAQEAHECIRPTELANQPKDLPSDIEAGDKKLYELIWKRSIASQMESARLERTTVEIRSPDAKVGLRATG